MSSDAFRELVVVFSTGLGLLVVGLAFILVGTRSRLNWAASVLFAACAAGVGPVAFNLAEFALIPTAAVIFTVLAISALRSRRLASAIASAYRCVASPVGAIALLLTAGVALMAGSLARHTIAEEAAMDRDTSLMEMTFTPPKTAPADSVELRTDKGIPIRALAAVEMRPAKVIGPAEHSLLEQQGFQERIIRTGPASDACNCHGWVFTGGRYWLAPGDVERILAENAYEPVSDPQPNDIAIYRNSDVISHTAIIRSATPGQPILVEGKWGWMGVFIHEVGSSCYGQHYTFYRSARIGHALAEEPKASQPQQGVARHANRNPRSTPAN
jgi:hypothetical protein